MSYKNTYVLAILILVVFSGNTALAQGVFHCDGNFYEFCGDNLVENGDFADMTCPATTFNSEFTPDCEPTTEGEAYYQLAIDASNWNPGLWVGTDHTGNGSGFLIGDGDTARAAVIWSQEVGVTAGQTYYFQAYGLNIAPCCDGPSLRFSIGDTVFFDNLIDTTEWQEICQVWTAPASKTVTIRMIIAKSAFVGHDFGVDDIAFYEACAESQPCDVTVSSDTAICAGDSATLQVSRGDTFSWKPTAGLADPDSQMTKASPDTTTTYTVVTKTYFPDIDSTCADTNEVTVTVNPLPNITATADTFVCTGQSIELVASGADTLRWQPPGSLSCTECDTTMATPAAATEYTVTAIDTNGCESADTVEIDVLDQGIPEVTLPPDTTICSGDSVTVTSLSPLDNYEWSTGDTTSEVTLQFGGIFWLESSNACGTGRDSIDLNVQPLPEVEAGEDTTIPQGYTAPLSGEGDGRLLWQPRELVECDTCAATNTVTLNDTVTHTFYLSAMDSLGCIQEDSVDIDVDFICHDIHIPNAFTPNNDGLNDQFAPVFKTGNQEFVNLRIYNRWGELMYQTNDVQAGWDGTFRGKPQDPGTYTYVLRYRCRDEPSTETGNVTLIR